MTVHFRATAIGLILLGTIAGVALAAERSHDITFEDYFTQAFITDCALSPDGKQVAYSEWRWQGPKNPRQTELWLVDCATKESRRLTFDPANDESPRWSPDGKSLYFSSNRKREGEKAPPYDGTTQVWRLELASGQQIPVTSVADGIDTWKLSADGKAIYYTTSDKHPTDEWKELRKDFSDLEYGHGNHKVSELWKLDLLNWRETRLYDEKRFIHSFDVSPDQRRIAMITTPDDLQMTAEGQSRVDVLNVKTSKVSTLPDELWRKQAPSPYGWLDRPVWSQDNRHLAFMVSYDGYPSELFVARWNADAPQVRKMPRPEDVHVDGNLHWRGKGSELCYVGDYHASNKVYCIRDVDAATPTTDALTPDDLVIDDVSFSLSGEQMAVVQTGLTYHGDIFLRQPGQIDDSTRLTHVNPQVDTWKLPQISRVTWKGANDDEVEGILELPPDYKPGKRLPLIVGLHGGPTAAENFGFQFWFYGNTLFAARGYAFFSPNYRGSTGYGDKFLTDLIGRENDIEVEDIMKGIDSLIEKGIADPERLGAIGWSNGGYLTNCLITHSNRFKAASSGAGVFDQTVQWGEEDTPGHVINFMRGLPWKRHAEYQKASPLYQLNESFKTPTLIHVGQKDERVPATHSKALHRALRHYLKTPTELIIYPNAGHSITSYNHRLAKMKWDHAWFDKYVRKEKSK